MTKPTAESETEVEKKPVKLKQVRRKYAEPKPDDKRLKANKQRSEAQIANQFKPGNDAGKTTIRSNNAKKNRVFREKCRELLTGLAMPMLLDKLSEEDLDTKHFLEIVKFLTLYGVGKPAEMEVEEEDKVDPSIINNIIISQEMINQAILNDSKHLVTSENSVINA